MHTQYSEDIRMEFVCDKCAKCTFVHGKTKRTDNISVDQNTTIQEIENEASDKYFGIEEGSKVQHKKMFKIISKEYLRINKTNSEVIPLSKKQNQRYKPTCSTGIPI